MRKISRENDYWQIAWIMLLIWAYFKFVYYVKNVSYPATFIFIVFLIQFALTILFFHIFTSFSSKESSLKSFTFTMVYSLFPTFIWFLANSILYLILPPPRTNSVSGITFSIVFISFSVAILIWKIILTYLAVRFSSKLPFYRIVYAMILYLCVLSPYIIVLYKLKLFRVPFI